MSRIIPLMSMLRHFIAVATGDVILLETGDSVLLETGDEVLVE